MNTEVDRFFLFLRILKADFEIEEILLDMIGSTR